jgi:hexosaminidase
MNASIILPAPRLVEPAAGVFTLASEVPLVVMEESWLPVAGQFADHLAVAMFNSGRGVVHAGPTDSPGITLTADPSLGEEGYALEVTPDGVKVHAGSATGAGWALATLLQLTRVDHSARYIPCGRVEDAPRFGYRGLLVDVARHPHTLLTLKKIVLLCWLYKIRYLQLHLTDMEAFTFPSRAFPQLATPHHHLPLAAWRELEAFAAAHNVIIVPELETPGHAWRGLRELCPTRPATGLPVLNPVSENTFRVLDTLIGEILEVFPRTPFFHIGADEVAYAGWRGCADCAAFLKERGLSDIRECYRYFIGRMNEIVKAHGRRTIVWEGFAREGAIPIPQDVIVQCGSGFGGFDMECLQPEEALALGHEIISSSNGPLYVLSGSGSCPPRTIHRWHPEIFGQGGVLPCVPDALDALPAFGAARTVELFYFRPLPGKERPFAKVIPPTEKLRGATMCAWELIEDDELPRLRRRLPAMSARLWHPEDRSGFDEFLRRLESTDALLDGLLDQLTLAHRHELPDYGRVGPEYTPFLRSWEVSAPRPRGRGKTPPRPGKTAGLDWQQRNYAGDCCIERAVFQANPDAVLYYRCRFTADKRVRMTALAGYDGPIAIWVNGRRVFADATGADPAKRDEIEAPFSARAGVNEILVGLGAADGQAWGFYLRLRQRLQPLAPLAKINFPDGRQSLTGGAAFPAGAAQGVGR